MKCLLTHEANSYLTSIGMEVGSWNQLRNSAAPGREKSVWCKYYAPKSSRELFSFSRHVAGWLPSGRWKIVQIDNSTSLNVDQASLVSKLLPCKEDLSDINSISTVLFEFGESKDLDLSTELQIANLIFAFLLFEAHAYVVSSASTDGQMIGIQDGFIYFFLSSETNDDAKNLIESFEREQLVSPIWLLDILAEREERAEKQGQE